jgi:hypothetical protein
MFLSIHRGSELTGMQAYLVFCMPVLSRVELRAIAGSSADPVSDSPLER